MQILKTRDCQNMYVALKTDQIGLSLPESMFRNTPEFE